MKPMDLSQTKQAAIQIERGDMPTGNIPAPERVSQPPSFGFDILQVQLPGQRQGGQLATDPSFMSSQVLKQAQLQESRQTSKVQETAQERQFKNIVNQMQRDDRAQGSTSRQSSNTILGQRIDLGIDQTSARTQTFDQVVTQRQDQKITTDYRPWEDTQRTITRTPDIGIPPGLPYLPGGGGTPSISNRRPRSFREYFPLGIDIASMAAMGKKPKHEKRKKGRAIPKAMLTKAKKAKK
jgi:hypothetical protein